MAPPRSVPASSPSVPLRAAAQDDSDDGDGWVDSALDGLVDDGTLTQSQADAVADTLQAAAPSTCRVGPWHHGGLFDFGGSVLDEAADAIGIEEDDLLDALRDGQTIAEVAEGEGVDPQAVIDALVAATRERLDDAVADGRIEQEDADGRLADATERITEFVNEGRVRSPSGSDVRAVTAGVRGPRGAPRPATRTTTTEDHETPADPRRTTPRRTPRARTSRRHAGHHEPRRELTARPTGGRQSQPRRRNIRYKAPEAPTETAVAAITPQSRPNPNTGRSSRSTR